MEELIARISTAAGINKDVATKSVGIILNFLRQDGPGEAVDQVMQALPGAEAAADAALAEHQAAGDGDGGGGLMALAGHLTGAGLDMGEMQAVGKELFAAVHEKAGPDAVGAIAGAIPGMHQFI